MDADRWKLVSRLYHDALQREGAEVDAFLADECSDDSALLAEVKELLTADAGAVDAFGDQISEAAAAREAAIPFWRAN